MSNLRKEQHEKALEMLRQGMTAGAVARATGYNKCYILEMARKNGISCGRSSIARCDEVIMSMAGAGKSLTEIGEAIGYSPVTVRNYLRGRGKRVEETIEIDYSKLTFAEPRRINITHVEHGGKVYTDVTDIYCPR